MNLNTILYRRVSTDHQDASLIVQEAGNDEYARRLGLVWGPDTTFEDEDVSGSIPMAERRGGGAMLNRLKAGDIHHLVTFKQERIGRDTFDIIRTIRSVWESGVMPHFVVEGGALPRTPSNELLMEIKASVSQYDRNQIRERVQLAATHKFVRFELTGNVPYGYDARYEFADGAHHMSARALCWGSKERPPEDAAADLIRAHGAVLRKLLISNPAELEWLFTMVAQRTAGQSYKAIARWLNACGSLTKQGRAWQCGSVASVLASRHTARIVEQSRAQSPESKVEPPATDPASDSGLGTADSGPA